MSVPVNKPEVKVNRWSCIAVETELFAARNKGAGFEVFARDSGDPPKEAIKGMTLEEFEELHAVIGRLITEIKGAAQ